MVAIKCKMIGGAAKDLRTKDEVLYFMALVEIS